MHKRNESLGESRAIFLIVLFAFVLRVAVIPFLLGDITNRARDHWDFGWEEGGSRGLSQVVKASVRRFSATQGLRHGLLRFIRIFLRLCFESSAFTRGPQPGPSSP